MVGLSLRFLPIDFGYLFVELKAGPRFTAGRYFTIELSVETRAPSCQPTPDIQHVCPNFPNRMPGPGTPEHSGRARHPLTLTAHFGVW